MDINANQIETIVRSVLSQMGTGAPSSGMARVAMLTAAKHFEVREFPIPPAGRRRDPRQGRGLRRVRHRRA